MTEEAAVLNHTGLCVTDMDRSVAFYREVFGFKFWRIHDAPDDLTVPLLSLAPPVGLHTVYLKLGTWVLELLQYRDARAHPPAAVRDMNELGLTHLNISVPDIDAACAKALEHGGTVLESTNIGLAVMIRDPDGQLIEVLTMSYAARVATIE